MILSHVWGLMSHPEEEWSSIDKESTSIINTYFSYVCILAAIPAVCWFYGTTQVGWTIAGSDAVKLTAESALPLTIAFYAAMLIGVYAMGRMIHWMAHTYGSTPTIAQCVRMAAYTATPIFLVGLLGLQPNIWMGLLLGMVAVSYTVYLLYVGVPVVMHIPKERGFLFASAVLGVGLVFLVGAMAATIVIWSFGFAPAFTS